MHSSSWLELSGFSGRSVAARRNRLLARPSSANRFDCGTCRKLRVHCSAAQPAVEARNLRTTADESESNLLPRLAVPSTSGNKDMKARLIGGPAHGKWLVVDEPEAGSRVPRARLVFFCLGMPPASEGNVVAHKYLVAGRRGVYFGLAHPDELRLYANSRRRGASPPRGEEE